MCLLRSAKVTINVMEAFKNTLFLRSESERRAYARVGWGRGGMDSLMDEWMLGKMDVWKDGEMDGWRDGWMNRGMYG